MEDLQTDTLSNYAKNVENTTDGKESENCTAVLLNGCDDMDDPLDLMDHCDNASIGSNSDIWKGSDSEDECFENNKDSSGENLNKNMNTERPPTPTEIVSESKEDEARQEENEEKVVNNKETGEEEAVKSCEEKQTDHKKNTEDVLVNESEKEKEAQDNSLEDKGETSCDNKEEPRGEYKQEPSAKDIEEQDVKSSENEPKKNFEESHRKEDAEVEEILLNDNDPSNRGEENEKDPLALPGDEDNKEEAKKCDKNNESQDDEDSQIDYNDDDDDFDPSLLCPEVSMAVDESPVITNSGTVPGDENTSPLPFEPVFSTFVDEVTGAEISFNLTPEELELKKRLYGPTNPIQCTKIHCTACNVHLGSALEGQKNRFVHPLLKVLICKECYHFYTSGEFEKDEDGSELYCRWCGQGGQVLCCSKCEFVFCKRCIRTNFSRKKMFEIRDSDNWDCFRCAPNQLITQRVACYEFFEYIRQEMARAATLNMPEVWSKDYTNCCSSKKRSGSESRDLEVKKPKRKKGEVDPDYTPLLDKMDVKPTTTSGVATSVKLQNMVAKQGITIPKPVQVVRFQGKKDNDIEFVRAIPAPQVVTQVRMPTYRTILPTTVRATAVRPVFQPPGIVKINAQPLPSPIPSGSRLLGNALQSSGSSLSSQIMKHEWFEKTVRAAARVNSQLSYTLTQLNKAQSQAASVEELAVVHNKLQEILSGSINSLIQIRKNLRTEFIAGIKTTRLPSKKAAETFSNDDDVIFVGGTPNSAMPTLTPCVPQPQKTQPTATATSVAATSDPIIIIDNSNRPAPTLLKEVTTEKPRLKVKSVMELQNVPSECITIPDDVPIVEDETKKEEEKAETVCNGEEEKSKTPEPENPECSDPTPDVSGEKETESESTPAPEITKSDESVDSSGNGEGNEQTEEEEKEESSEKSEENIESEQVAPSEESKKSDDDVEVVIIDSNKRSIENSESSTPTSDNNNERVEPSAKRFKLEIDLSDQESRTKRSRNSNNCVYDLNDEPSGEIKRMLSVSVKLPRIDLEKLQKQLPNGCH